MLVVYACFSEVTISSRNQALTVDSRESRRLSIDLSNARAIAYIESARDAETLATGQLIRSDPRDLALSRDRMIFLAIKAGGKVSGERSSKSRDPIVATSIIAPR